MRGFVVRLLALLVLPLTLVFVSSGVASATWVYGDDGFVAEADWEVNQPFALNDQKCAVAGYYAWDDTTAPETVEIRIKGNCKRQVLSDQTDLYLEFTGEGCSFASDVEHDTEGGFTMVATLDLVWRTGSYVRTACVIDTMNACHHSESNGPTSCNSGMNNADGIPWITVPFALGSPPGPAAPATHTECPYFYPTATPKYESIGVSGGTFRVKQTWTIMVTAAGVGKQLRWYALEVPGESGSTWSPVDGGSNQVQFDGGALGDTLPAAGLHTLAVSRYSSVHTGISDGSVHFTSHPPQGAGLYVNMASAPLSGYPAQSSNFYTTAGLWNGTNNVYAANQPSSCRFYAGPKLSSTSSDDTDEPLGPSTTGTPVPLPDAPVEPTVETPDPDDPEGDDTGDACDFDPLSPSTWLEGGMCLVATGITDLLGLMRDLIASVANLAADIAAAIGGAIQSALSWAFVPGDGFFEGQVDEVQTAWEDTPPGEIAEVAGGLPAMFDVPASSGCDGPGMTLDMPMTGEAVTLHLLSTCNASMATVAQILYRGLQVGVWLGAFMVGLRLILGSLGYSISWGRGDGEPT